MKSLKKLNNRFATWSKKSPFFAPFLSLLFSPFFICCQDTARTEPGKSFVIIVSAYNASAICEKALQSFASQTYPRFRVVYVDDGSKDATREKVEKLINASPQKNRFSFIHHETRKGSVERLIEEAQKCENEEVILFLEGNALLASSDVLQKLNELYCTKDAWVVWGQHQELETKMRGRCKKVTSELLFSSSMRRKNWTRCRIKSFYASLFKQIHLSDFFFRGKCVDETWDAAYMFSLLEMAKKHAVFVKDVLCLYSQKEEVDNTRPCQKAPFKCEQMIRRISPYPLLKEPFFSLPSSSMADLIIFSYDRPLQLYALLESIEKHVKGLHQISILFRTSSPSFERAYLDLQKEFSQIHWIAQSHDHPKEDFQKLFLQTLFSSPSPYVIFAVDDMVVKKDCNLQECASLLEKNHAFFFSLRLGKDICKCYMGKYDQAIPHHLFLAPNLFAWQINAAQGDWNYATSVDMTLYRKKELKKCFTSISFHNPNELENFWALWQKSLQDKKSIGLCYEEPIVMNIPLNIVHQSENPNMNLLSSKDLLLLYERGYKIDLAPLEKVKNQFVHVEIVPAFIRREKTFGCIQSK